MEASTSFTARRAASLARKGTVVANIPTLHLGRDGDDGDGIASRVDTGFVKERHVEQDDGG